MRILILMLFAVIAFTGAPASYAQNAQRAPVFFKTLNDVPLMAGLVELEDQAVYFDKPEGRIIEAYAVLNGISQEDVLAYYKMILPQFGWGESGAKSFYRAGEVLEIGFIEDADHPLIKIMIRPSL